jgi:DNA polymerase-3 subunit epsilon
MLVVVLDTETTGFKYDDKDRVIELCLDLWELDATGMRRLKTLTYRINPERAIPEEAQAVHGISYEDVKDAPKWRDINDTVVKVLSRADLVVAHNAEFDRNFVDAEMRRCGVELDWKPIFCTMEHSRWATFDGKSSSLKELCWSLGIDYDDTAAHSADYDTMVTAQCFKKGLELGLFINPVK